MRPIECCPLFQPAAEHVGTVRCRALVSRTEARILAASDPSAAAALLNDAAEQLRHSPYEAALWDVLLDCSALARATGDRASAGLLAQEVHSSAAMHGAGMAMARACAEMAIAGRRPRASARSSTALTPTERRVAALAADGLGNREIAAELFVSRKAVEFHLTNVYRKLGIGSQQRAPRQAAVRAAIAGA